MLSRVSSITSDRRSSDHVEPRTLRETKYMVRTITTLRSRLSRAEAWFIIFPTVASCVLFSAFMVSRDVQSQRDLKQSSLQQIRIQLEERIATSEGLLHGLDAFVKAHDGDFDLHSFQRFAEPLHGSLPQIFALQVAPDGFVRFSTDMARNGAAIGLDLLKPHSEEGRRLYEAARNRMTTLKGPVDLVQGGNAVIARMPVFIPGSRSRTDIPDFYGFVTVIIDTDSIFRDLSSALDGVAIRGRHGLGADGEVFLNQPGIFDEPNISLSVSVPNGEWIIAVAEPGWSDALPTFLLWTMVTLLVIVLVAYGLLRFLAFKEKASRIAAERLRRLRSSEQRFKDIVEVAADWVWEMDRDLRFSYLSNRAFEVYEIEPKDFLGKTRAELAGNPELDETWRAHLDLLNAHKPFRDMEYEYVKPSGETGHSRISGKPIFGETGEFLGYRGTGTDITENVRARSELKAAREAAETANRAKTTFLSTMSHELRTPLNAIIGLVDLLEKTGLDSHQRRMLTTTRASSYALLSIVNDVLDFSKIEAGDMQLEHIAFSVFDVVEGVALMMHESARAKSLDLRVYVSPDISENFVGDPTRLRQILINLVGNAIKFTSVGEVCVSAVPEGEPDDGRETIRIDVTDTGIGLAPEAMEKIFEPFAQAEASTTRKYGGTGLGLSICRRIAEAMGGELRVESVPGEGTTFSLVVGLARGEAPAAGSPWIDLDGVNVLVFSANPDIAEMRAVYLRKCRASVDVFTDPDEAVDLARGAGERGRPYKVVVFGDTLTESAKSQFAERIRGLDGGDGVGFVSVERVTQDAVVLVSPMGVILGLNHAAEALFGRSRRELIGSKFGLPVLVDEVSTADIPHSSGTFTTCELRAHTTLQSKEKNIEVRLHDIAQDRVRPDNGFVRVTSAPLFRTDLLTAVAEAAGRLRGVAADRESQLTDVATPQVALTIDEAEQENRLVLVVEDNETNQMVLDLQLAQFGFVAQIASNGAEALELAKHRSYCLVLLDCHMPVMGGFEFAQRYRASGYRGAADVPIIAVTGNVVKEEIEHCYSVGMNDFLAKPVELPKLELMLRKWLKSFGLAPAEGEPDNVSTGQSDDDPEGEGIALDRSAIEKYVGSNPEFRKQIIEKFKTSLEGALAEFELAYREQEASGIRQVCHRLKSAARTVGANGLADCCASLEEAAQKSDWVILERDAPRLQTLAEKTAIVFRGVV